MCFSTRRRKGGFDLGGKWSEGESLTWGDSWNENVLKGSSCCLDRGVLTLWLCVWFRSASTLCPASRAARPPRWAPLKAASVTICQTDLQTLYLSKMLRRANLCPLLGPDITVHHPRCASPVPSLSCCRPPLLTQGTRLSQTKSLCVVQSWKGRHSNHSHMFSLWATTQHHR